MEEQKIIRRSIRGKGEVDYDFKHDILFFKIKDRRYAKSIELLDSIVADVDKDGFLVGIQIFDASKFLKLDKKELLSIPIDKNPIIAQQINQKLPDSEMVCEAVV